MADGTSIPTGRAHTQSVARSHRSSRRPPFECIALLLQGGGALGSYQAGVYQALAEADLHPDWVAGISIGAINSALIAGNPPEQRVETLRGFWESITRQSAARLGRRCSTAWLQGRSARAASSTS